VSTYALYTGWESDRRAPGRKQYRKSNLVLVGMLCSSILAAASMQLLLRLFGGNNDKRNADVVGGTEDMIEDGAARREVKQRGLEGLWFWKGVS